MKSTNNTVLPKMGRHTTQSTGSELTVRRTTGYADRLRKYSVKLDGESVGDLAAMKSITIPLSAGKHELVVTVDWCRSNIVEFQCDQDDTIVFDCGSSLKGFRILLAVFYTTFLRHKYLWLRESSRESAPS